MNLPKFKLAISLMWSSNVCALDFFCLINRYEQETNRLNQVLSSFFFFFSGSHNLQWIFIQEIRTLLFDFIYFSGETGKYMPFDLIYSIQYIQLWLTFHSIWLFNFSHHRFQSHSFFFVSKLYLFIKHIIHPEAVNLTVHALIYYISIFLIGDLNVWQRSRIFFLIWRTLFFRFE